MRLDKASGVRDAVVIALWERLREMRLGKSLVINGMSDSLERGGVDAPGDITVGTRSFKLQPSRSNSCKHGKKLVVFSEKLGRWNDLSMRRLERIRTRRLDAKGRATIVDNGSVGAGTVISSVRGESLDAGVGAATEKARACPNFEGGAEGGR
jgi:hypothetical protein